MISLKIRLSKVSKVFKPGNEGIMALKKINLEVKDGDYIGIMGPSGSGKTTLLNVMGLLDKPTSGEVLIDGVKTSGMRDSKLSRIRLEGYGFIFQKFYLIPSLTARENVYLPMKEAGLSRSEALRRAEYLLDQVGIKNRSKHLPYQLSGGEQQRVAIARALANDPDTILADEPTGELDTENSRGIMSIFSEMNKDLGKTLVVVSHDPTISKRANRSIKMKDGKLKR